MSVRRDSLIKLDIPHARLCLAGVLVMYTIFTVIFASNILRLESDLRAFAAHAGSICPGFCPLELNHLGLLLELMCV